MPIQLLTEKVVSQIAAGEVVERPASVVKELLENALDAGARNINVTVEGGGRALLRVADDGSGILAEEVELAFARHATSKLADAPDLFRIQTLGFRGEALASIAAVSQVTMLTRAVSEPAGTQVRLEGGQLTQRTAVGAPQGTVVSVENLFFNVPARLKFLKSETAERSHLTTLVSRYALAYPLVRFKLTLDNRTAFQSNGSGDVREVLAAIYGVEIAKQLIELGGLYTAPPAAAPEEEPDDWALREGRSGLFQVAGFVSPPALNRSNRRDITLFVNGRWVQDVRLAAAVLQAYHTLLMVGRYPIAVVQLTVPPEEVDVNVHPTKAEVRFRNSDGAFTAVERAVRRALTERAPVPQIEPRQWHTEAASPGEPATWSPDWSRLNAVGASAGARSALTGSAGGPAPALQTPLPATGVPLLRVIGQVGAAYIVAEGPDGLYLIDQHAAHERVLYEAFNLQRAAAQVVSQALLEPVAVEVAPEAATLLADQMTTLNQIGFSIEPFGGNTFLVRALPVVLGKVDPVRAVRVVIEDFEEDETVLAAEVEARLIARVCKRAAVKAGQVLPMPEMLELVQKLEQCVSPRTCPHGRPTMIHLSVETLERQFGRK